MNTSSVTPNRVDVLDWLRAIAIIVVVFGHSNRPMFPGGAVGVSIFFALSGYLIASILLREDAFKPRNLLVFFIRRVTRIYPLYLLSVLGMCVFFYLTSNEVIYNIHPYLIQILTFTGETERWVGYSFGVLWTLAVEFWFYLTFPLLLLVGVLCRRVLLVLAIGILVSMASKVFQFGGPVLNYYDHFLVGAMAFAAHQTNSVPQWLRGGWVLLAGALLIAATVIFPHPGSRNLAWYTLSGLAAMGTALVILYSNLHPISASNQTLSFIGRISYSIYLVHAMLLDISPRFLSNIPIYLSAVLVCSTATYLLVEQPVIKWAHRKFRFHYKAPLPA